MIHPRGFKNGRILYTARLENKEIGLAEVVFQYITNASYPMLASNNVKRAIRNKAKKFKSVMESYIYYVNVKGGRGSKKVSICNMYTASGC